MHYYKRAGVRLRAGVCVGCGRQFVGAGLPLCTACQNALPYTYFWEFDCDAALQSLSPIVHLEHIFPLFFYTHDSLVPKLIHTFKYRGKWHLATALGEMLGRRLHGSPLAHGLGAVIPVPLHWRKKMIRGYNQAEYIARGIARQTGLPLYLALRRQRFTKTQTLVDSHYERLANVNRAFTLRPGVSLRPGTHVLLIDDMITTGSTLMACANALQAELDVRVSAASVGIARSLITGDRYIELPSYPNVAPL